MFDRLTPYTITRYTEFPWSAYCEAPTALFRPIRLIRPTR